MQFGRFPVAGATGAILAHGVRQADLSFRKGHILSADDIKALQEAGISYITIAWAEPGDVPEDKAAARIADAAATEDRSVRVGAAFTGRVNLYAQTTGLVLIDAAAIDAANAQDEAITLATLQPFAKVTAGQMLATIKIIPFAARETSIASVEKLLAMAPPIRVAPFLPRAVALISTRLPGMKPALLDKNRAALDARLKPLGSAIAFERRDRGGGRIWRRSHSAVRGQRHRRPARCSARRVGAGWGPNLGSGHAGRSRQSADDGIPG
jgi:molybdenum cofactor cytidylyltransferase